MGKRYDVGKRYCLFFNINSPEVIFGLTEDGQKLGNDLIANGKLCKIGDVMSNFTGVFPFQPDIWQSSLKGIYGVSNDVKQFRELVEKKCMSTAVEDLEERFINNLRYEGPICSLEYTGDQSPIGKNILIGSGRSFSRHQDIEDFSIAEQFFAFEDLETKLVQLCEPTVGMDVKTNRHTTEHCYIVAKSKVKTDYEFYNNIGSIDTSASIVRKINAINLLEINEETAALFEMMRN